MTVTGSIDLTARRSGRQTVLERIRYDGISRCSRAFAHADAALVVLSQLGPGVVRGDQVRLSGRLRAGSHLIVTNQSATRLMGGKLASAAHVVWTVGAGATLELIGEPLVASADARYASATSIELEPGARVLVSEIACVPNAANVRLRTTVRQAGRDVFYDAVDASKAAPNVVGTVAVVGLAPDAIAALLAAFDAIAGPTDVLTIGVGVLASGLFVRILGADVWSVRAAALECCALARAYAFARPALEAAAG